MKTTKSIEYLTQAEHARRLGLSRQSIYNAQKVCPKFKTVKFTNAITSSGKTGACAYRREISYGNYQSA